MFPILRTPRTTLREITEVDADTIFDCFSQKEVIRYYGQEKFTTIQEALVLIDILLKITEIKKACAGELNGSIRRN